MADVHHIEQALKAHALFKLDRDYIVKEGEVIIVDEFTGRILSGRRYSDGLHQALEAKEGVEIEDFDAVMHTNVLGAMQIISTLAPQVTPQTGKMVFMSSLMASIELTNSSSAWVYKASKAALNMCVKSASSSYPNICMLSMSPGWVKTDMGGEFAPLTPSESVKGILQTIAQTSLVDTGRFLNYLNTKLPY